jgi:hypothetical protein
MRCVSAQPVQKYDGLRERSQQKWCGGRWLGVYLVLAKSLAGAINLIFMVYPQKYKNCSTLDVDDFSSI